jgi:hypothetical protein
MNQPMSSTFSSFKNSLNPFKDLSSDKVSKANKNSGVKNTGVEALC